MCHINQKDKLQFYKEKMKEYSTSTLAKEFNIHPNTVRFYEEIGCLPQIS